MYNMYKRGSLPPQLSLSFLIEVLAVVLPSSKNKQRWGFPLFISAAGPIYNYEQSTSRLIVLTFLFRFSPDLGRTFLRCDIRVFAVVRPAFQ